jgi:type IV pilus modification protein PilV
MIAHKSRSSGRRQRGFTLIEALVALLVMAFGMLAIAGMQATLSRASEVAKQRSEAVRLAQMKIEQLRSFEQITADAGKVDYASDVVSGNDTFSPTVGAYATNTSFDRVWTVTRDGVNAPAADGSDPQKWVSVVVTWNDRTGQQQRVQLTTVISRADPVNLGTLYTGSNITEPLKPKGRNIDIPYPAVSLPGDKSAFKPPPSTNNYVFDNVSGDVLGFCTDAAIADAVNNGTAISFTGTPTTGCTVQPAYVLSGYIRFLNSVPPDNNELNYDSAITNPTTATKALTASIVFPTVGSGTPAADCFAQQQKVVSVGNITVRDIATISRTGNTVTVTTTANHGFSPGQVVAINNVSNSSFNGTFMLASASGNNFTYAQTGANVTVTVGTPTPTAALVQQIALEESATPPTGYNSVVSRFVAYTCIVQGIDDAETPQPVPATRKRWWGQFVITTDGTWQLDNGLGDGTRFKMCRFTGDYIADDNISNSEHPLLYRGVNAALDNQNYLIVPGNVACPNDGEADPLNGANDYSNTNTELHQIQDVATGTAPYGGNLSNSQWSTAGREQATTNLTPLPMF